jgi:2-oxoglutarate ferredoxin oxidoreductase subunit gamma
MQTEVVISGFGGQGVLFAGQMLAYAAMDEGLHVTWFPSYGPEMRGGTANCTIIFSDEEIGSPTVRNPQAVIALNLPSIDKYEPEIKADGLLIANRSLINREIERTDIKIIEINANEIADEVGDKRLVNMVMVGALISATQIVPMKALKQALKDHLPKHRQDLLPANFTALERGSELAQQQLPRTIFGKLESANIFRF